MSEILYRIITSKVFDQEKIKQISSDATGKEMRWIFDFKAVALSPEFLRAFARAFWDSVGTSFGNSVQIGGLEAGAIALVSAIVLSAPKDISVNGFFIRKSRKKNDLANLIEGNLSEDAPIILVDDILNTGGSIRKQLAVLEDLGHTAQAVFVCLRFRDLEFYADLKRKGISIQSIFELNDFSSSLPVENLPTEQPIPLRTSFSCAYKLRLTKHPNLYSVVPKSAPLLHNSRIFMGVDDGTFYCLDANDGGVLWTYKILFGAGGKKIFSSPAECRGSIIFGAYDGNVYCLDAMTGKRRWVFMDADWVGSSPCVDADNGVAYIGLEFGHPTKRGGIAALDVSTGNVLWKNYDMAGLTHASPIYDKTSKSVFCGCNDRCFYSFDARTGKIRWKFETQGEIKYGAAIDTKRQNVLVGSMDGGLYVLHAHTGKLAHRFAARAGFYSTPAISGDLAVIGSLDKKIYCYNLSASRVAWEYETNGRVFASPVIDDTDVFIGSNDGRLYQFDLISGSLRSSLQFTERIVNAIALGRDYIGKRILFVPTHAGELFRMEENAPN